MGDNIKKPDHYCEGRKYEPKDVIRDWGLNFNLGSAVKYISRAGRKGDKLEDLKKAKQFLQFEIEAVEEEEKSDIGMTCKEAVEICDAIAKGFEEGFESVEDAFTLSFKEETEQEEVLSLADTISMIMKHNDIPEPDVIKLHFKFEDDPTAIPANTVSIKFHTTRKEI